MSDRSYFVAAGRSLERVREWQEAEQAAHEKAWEIVTRVGAEKVSTWSNPYRVAGFGFAAGKVPFRGWRKTKHDVWLPERRTKEGKELYGEIKSIVGADFDSRMGARDMMLVGRVVKRCAFETFGDQIIVSVPNRDDGEPFFVPEDAVPLKMSEYWAMKEAAA